MHFITIVTQKILMHHMTAGKFSLQLSHFSTEVSPAFRRFPKISNKRLIVKLVGIDAIAFCGRGAQHNGQ